MKYNPFKLFGYKFYMLSDMDNMCCQNLLHTSKLGMGHIDVHTNNLG